MTRIIELLNQARDERDAAPPPAPKPMLAFEPEPLPRLKPPPAPGRSAAAMAAAPKRQRPPAVPPGMQVEVAQLFARLQPLLDERGALVVHVAAAQAGEGTTTIARTLAAHVGSLRRYRTLLIDATGLPGGGGHSLAGAVRAGVDPETVVSASGSDWLGVAILTGADTDAEPSVAEMGQICDAMRERWPVIVVEGPPILARPDSVNLARRSDGVLLVVRAEQPSHENLVRARDLLEASGANILGLVLNRFQSHIPSFIERRM